MESLVETCEMGLQSLEPAQPPNGDSAMKQATRPCTTRECFPLSIAGNSARKPQIAGVFG